MMLLKSLLLLSTLFEPSFAYYPWIPEYRCIYDHTCSAEKRDSHAGNSLKIVQRLPNKNLPHDVHVRRLANRLAEKYQKRTNTHSIVTAAAPTQTNSAGIDQDGTDYSYFAQVLLGSANTPIYLLLDTGAGQSWVMGPSCKSSPCQTHDSFGAPDSTTFKAIDGSSWSVTYGSGAVSGTFGNDSLSFAGMTLPVTLGIANVTSDDFNDFPMDGILGLSQATGQYPNFIQSLVASKTLKSNLFGMSLNRESDGPNTGEISFGSPDGAKYIGSINYTTVSENAEGDWAIPLDSISFAGKDSGITGKLAYIDTGTSYIFGPADDVAKFHALVPGAQSSDDSTWTVPCTTTSPLTFTFSGIAYNTSSKDWVGPMANGVCTSNVFGNPIVAGEWLLGDTFLKNVYSVFDIDRDRVGFALKPGSSSATSSGTSSGGQLSSTNPSSATVSAGSTSSSSETTSNSGPTGSALISPTTAPASTIAGHPPTSGTGMSGSNGHQTSGASVTAAAESSASATISATQADIAAHLGIRFPTMFITAVALLILLS